MPINALLRWGACCLCLGLSTAIASVDCNEPSTPEAGNSVSSAGRQYLGQGISLYETRKLELAEKALQASLFAGLTDGHERSTAINTLRSFIAPIGNGPGATPHSTQLSTRALRSRSKRTSCRTRRGGMPIRRHTASAAQSAAGPWQVSATVKDLPQGMATLLPFRSTAL